MRQRHCLPAEAFWHHVTRSFASTSLFWREGRSPSRVMAHQVTTRHKSPKIHTIYLSFARSNDGREPPALSGVHQQENDIMAFNKLLQLFHIPAGLLQGDARKVHWVSRHRDAHVEPSGILGKHPDIQMSEANI